MDHRPHKAGLRKSAKTVGFAMCKLVVSRLGPAIFEQDRQSGPDALFVGIRLLAQVFFDQASCQSPDDWLHPAGLQQTRRPPLRERE